MRKTLAFLLLWLLWVPLAGCEEEEGSSSNPAARISIPLESFCAQFAASTADQYLRCAGEYINEEDTAALTRVCEDILLPAVEADAVLYDGREATACLLAQRSQCQNVLESGTCLALRGTLAPGEPCYSDLECAQGVCEQEEACPGVCSQIAPAGGSCQDRACGKDSYCTENLLCARRLGEGGACSRDEQCVAGLVCVCEGDSFCGSLPEESQGSCAPPPAPAQEGAPCGEARACDAGLFCQTAQNTSYDSEGLCRPRRQPGESCQVGGLDLEWFYRGCENALCQPEAPGSGIGLCALSEVGQPCAHVELDGPDFSTSARECTGELVCDEDSGLCRMSFGQGQFDPPLCLRP